MKKIHTTHFQPMAGPDFFKSRILCAKTLAYTQINDVIGTFTPISPSNTYKVTKDRNIPMAGCV